MARSGDGLIMIRRIETQKEIAQTMADNPNITYLAGSQGGGGGDGGKGASYLLGLRT